MSLESIIAFSLAMAVFAASPGPCLFSIIAQAMTRGSFSAFIQLTGNILGDVLYLLASIYGLSILATQLGGFFLIIKLIGAAYLIWLGWTSWSANIEPNNSLPPVPEKRSFFIGLLLSLGNPKVMIFYLAFLPTFIDLTVIQHSDVFTLTAITIALLYLIVGVYIFAAAKLRMTINKPSSRKLFNRISGSIMMGAGLTIAIRH